MNITPTPGLVLLVCLGAVLIVIASLRQFWIAWEERRERINRSALTRVEARSATLRYRMDSRLRRSRLGPPVESELAAAGLDMSVMAALSAVAVAMVGVFMLINAVAPMWLAVLGLYGAWRGVRSYLGRRQERRVEEVTAQLPELARTISNAASAGRSLPSAIRLASRELEDPASTELRIVAEELRIGRSLDDALERMQDRLPNREIGVMVTTLLIQNRSGGDLVRALRDLAETLEKRKDLRGEIKTLMAGAVYTGYAVVFLGLGAIMLLNSIQPGALDQVLASWIGRGIALISAVLYAFGILLIRRETSIDV